MQVLDIPIVNVFAAPWNANEMGLAMSGRLRHSIERFGVVVPLVVRGDCRSCLRDHLRRSAAGRHP